MRFKTPRQHNSQDEIGIEYQGRQNKDSHGGSTTSTACPEMPGAFLHGPR
jgi:hypothetical protein